MILLADNDIILKLAQCDMLGDLPELLGESTDEILVTPTARYQLLPKNAVKAREKCGSEVVVERVQAFLDMAKVIPAIIDQDLLKTLSGIDRIDDGEALLFAAASELAGSLLITGDRKALCALLANVDLIPLLVPALNGRVVTFESAILLALHKFGFAIVKQKLLGCPKPDAMLRLLLKPDMRESDLIDCLVSYSKEIEPMLALRHLLPMNRPIAT
ncbi:hypothetical protein [Methylococcus sp. EFPC2]|uniref:hypothetical protein n=1 Tax=Methylococcus sp. EFPC2 TaxID=2812648 RepID=UPI001967A5CC|nr:hypothetical protein [Methylococcus sp. EFPC2]QSA98719.1 hypothetical protein JWZ97_08030 [Methylococcus sp. EFPC2]